MVRDQLRTKEYFDIFIDEDTVRTKKYIEFLNDKRILEDKIHCIKENIFELKLGILFAKYSRGDLIEFLQNEYIILVEFWKEACSLEWVEISYEETLWFVSLCILFRIEDELKSSIKEKLEEENINDWLLNFLLSSGEEQPDQIEGELLMPEKYQTVKDAICTSDKKLLVHYLEKEWYHNCKDYGWYDSHKLTRRGQRLYFGYWCFEAGAVVKLLKWEDSDIKERQYYPYDLVHFKM